MAPNKKKVEKKHVHLNVMQKLQLIEKLEQGASVKDVCKIYDVEQSTVSGILKSKTKLQQYISSHNIHSSKLDTSVIGNKKSFKIGPNSNIDKALYKWYSRQRSRGINVQQSQLKSQFEALRTRMGLNITHTSAWLTHFKTRHDITLFLSNGISSESSASEKKINNEEQVRQEESSNVGNVPSSSISSRIASTRHDISNLNASTIGKKKCMLRSPNFDLDKALYKWYSLQRSRGINVQQSQLKSQFEALRTRMGLNITAKNHWLRNFKTRHGITVFLSDGISSESSASEKKISNEEQVRQEESSNVGNVPSSSISSRIASTRHISKLNTTAIRKKKCMKRGPNCDLDKALYKWYSLQRSRGINVQQSQLKSQFEALMTRMRLNIKDAEKWLQHFKKRNGITSFVSDVLCSESSESEMKIINEEQVRPEESIKFGNVPSPSVSSPIASTRHNIPELSIKAEDLSSPVLPSTRASAHQNISEESINVENMPSSSFLPPIVSTQSKISEDSIKVENSSPGSYSSQTDVYHNYVWEEYDIKSEGCPSPLDDKSSDDN
ncbi:PREDICTED: uncharacterized protein LOC105559775 isoform X2 [Vollenhovia emeryi]|uniref:uncharacterized protein LOC105559775 isoform X2 n=1 Tax=Vollenhovia emeryi TaxID=411798 RepID=UPI0005F38492|nr:PREDICTED: uncharacterized protein LOC105559775 isoform X2 [Vollenhovia emeryi]XP_011863734.1 PREDICTED: uncharacterized protein LOC105559775 isoform X2 [Vollenhovia emeryi]